MLWLVAFSAPAFAQTVDSQGAVRLTESLARYVGKAAFDKGILKIDADGDAYRIDFDFKPLVAMVPATVPFKIDIAPYALKVRPLSETTWQVDGPLLPGGSFEVSQPAVRLRVEWSVTDGKMAGVYDTELAAFSSATASYASIKLHTETPEGSGDTEYGAGSITMAATRSANGGVDFQSKQVSSSYQQLQFIKAPGNDASFPISVEAGTSSMDTQATGMKAKSLLDMLAFGIANPDLDKLKANQAELRSLLLAALPLWDRQGGTYALTDLALNSPVGIVRAAEIGVAFAMDGVEKSASLDYGVKVEGMDVSSFFMPPWAKSLIPTTVDLNLGGTNIDLETPARKVIEAFDLNRDPPVPAAVSDAIAAAFMADPPKFVLSKSTVGNADSQLAVEGEVAFPGGRPVVHMTCEMTGYDRLVATLQAAAATDPRVENVLPAILVAKQFAVASSDGALRWVVQVRDDGSIAVNDRQVKPADPATTP